MDRVASLANRGPAATAEMTRLEIHEAGYCGKVIKSGESWETCGGDVAQHRVPPPSQSHPCLVQRHKHQEAVLYIIGKSTSEIY